MGVGLGGLEVLKDVARTPGGADEDFPGVGVEGGQDIAGDDGDGFIHLFDGAGVGFVVDVVGEEHAGGVQADDKGGAVAEADERRIAAFVLGAELTPGGVVHIVAFDLEAARHGPGKLFIGDDVGKGDAPTEVVLDEVGDLAAGDPSGSRSGLQDEETIVRVEAEAKGKEGDGDGGSFGGAAECFNYESSPFGVGRVELAHPAEGVERDIAAEEHAIELGKAFRIVWKSGGWFDRFPQNEISDRRSLIADCGFGDQKAHANYCTEWGVCGGFGEYVKDALYFT